MNILKRIGFILLIVLLCAGCDQSTKLLASSYLEPNVVISYAGDLFRLQLVENKGAFLGLGGGLSEEFRYSIFTILVSVFLLAIFLYTSFSSKVRIYDVVAFSIVIGGGVSNLYDRIVNNGLVVDFMNMGIGGLRTGIFNVADVFIMAGFIMLVFHPLVEGRRRNNAVNK